MGTEGFAHQALLYDSLDTFVEQVAAFLQPAIAAGDPVTVVVDEHKHEPLQAALGNGLPVTYLDVRAVGRNPAHLIPLWHAFLDDGRATSGPHWGVSEALWSGRSLAEAAECHRYETLLPVALADSSPMTLLCPLDVSELSDGAVAAALSTHPEIYDTSARANDRYVEGDPQALLTEPLAPAPTDATEFRFTDADLRALRAHVATMASGVGFDRRQADDLVLAVDEVATNSYRYGGGGGVLRTWPDATGIVFEVRDRGRFTDPMVGSLRPSSREVGGRGLWIANQLCDLVQVRSTADGAVVRLHARPADATGVTPPR